MDNQHQRITGYRDLTEEEIALMNEIKAKSAEVGALVETLRAGLPVFATDDVQEEAPAADDFVLVALSPDAFEVDRWLNIGQDHLQQGFMALTRAVARPTSF
ncbi:hypothetical protein R0381_003647 [Jeongeupia wiesaeckerbachi]|uniref:Acb2/Tad1 domain-containing protein n=1 Tax=Jeongeupia wiesaeckerbachi TaxID=3051218 RepID=UPI003D807397